jgi:hypothetical protein
MHEYVNLISSVQYQLKWHCLFVIIDESQLPGELLKFEEFEIGIVLCVAGVHHSVLAWKISSGTRRLHWTSAGPESIQETHGRKCKCRFTSTVIESVCVCVCPGAYSCVG